MPSPFYNARLVEFAAQVRMWPVVIRSAANETTATCIMTPERLEKRMTGNSYMDVIMVTVDALRTDCATLALTPTPAVQRPRFTVVSSGVTYEVQKIGDDSNEPTLQLQCSRVQ
jgi:hypothetical protein